MPSPTYLRDKMNRHLKRIKDIAQHLNGEKAKNDYRYLQLMKDQIEQYEQVLYKKDFSIDWQFGFMDIGFYVKHEFENIFFQFQDEKYRLHSRWCSEKDKNECLEIFMVKQKNKFKIGVCAYRKGFEIAGPYVNMYGRKKMLEFHKPSKRGNVLSTVISKLPGFRKVEENFYVLALTAPSSMSEFKKSVFPLFKSAYLSLCQLDKQLENHF